MTICEYCGEHEVVFSIVVTSPDGSVEESDLVCPNCIGTWFTESPEDVERMSVVRLEAD